MDENGTSNVEAVVLNNTDAVKDTKIILIHQLYSTQGLDGHKGVSEGLR